MCVWECVYASSKHLSEWASGKTSNGLLVLHWSAIWTLGKFCQRITIAACNWNEESKCQRAKPNQRQTKRTHTQNKSSDNPLPNWIYISRSVKIRATSSKTTKKLVYNTRVSNVPYKQPMLTQWIRKRGQVTTPAQHTHTPCQMFQSNQCIRMHVFPSCSAFVFFYAREKFLFDIKLNLMKPI